MVRSGNSSAASARPEYCVHVRADAWVPAIRLLVFARCGVAGLDAPSATGPEPRALLAARCRALGHDVEMLALASEQDSDVVVATRRLVLRASSRAARDAHYYSADPVAEATADGANRHVPGPRSASRGSLIWSGYG